MTRARELAKVSTAYETGGAFGHRNKIINGDGLIYQRSNSAALTTTASYVSVDRWFALQETSAASTFGISSTGIGTGSRQQMALNRNNGATSTGRISAGQIIESFNVLDLQGSTATLSFKARAGTTFSASGSSIQVQVYSGTTADQGLTSLQGGSWAGLSGILDTTQVITTTNTIYTFTFNVPSGCKELAVFLRFTPTGTAGADDTLYFTEAQIERGKVATPFEMRQYGTELALCQRYLPAIYMTNSYYGSGQWYSSASGTVSLPLPVTPRVAPTGYTTTTGSLQFFASNGGVASGTVVFFTASQYAMVFNNASSSGQTAGYAATMGGTTALTILPTGCEL